MLGKILVKSLLCPVPTAGVLLMRGEIPPVGVSSPHSLLVSAGAAKGRALAVRSPFLGAGWEVGQDTQTCTRAPHIHCEGSGPCVLSLWVPGTWHHAWHTVGHFCMCSG